MAQKKNENYEYKGSLYNRSRQDKMTQSRPKRLRFLLPVALTIIVLATVTALLLSAFGDSKGKFDKLVKKGDYEAAWEYAESKLSGDEEVMDQIQQEMGQKVKDLEALYVSEEATLEVTLEEMGQVSKIASVETEAQDAVGRITELSVSREDWASAVAKEEEGDYVAAMGMYDKVVERDANYSAAREKVEACFQAVKSDALQKAEALRAEGRHDEAIQVLGDCQAVREDAEVTAKLTEVLGEKQAIEAQVAEAARLEAERVAEEQRVAAEQRKAYVRGLIRVTRVSCDDPDSKGGVNLYVNFKNMAKEKMKQVIFRVVPVDDAGNVLVCGKTNQSVFAAMIKGPFRTGDGVTDQNRYWPDAWNNPAITGAKIESVEIAYAGGRNEKIEGGDVADVCDFK